VEVVGETRRDAAVRSAAATILTIPRLLAKCALARLSSIEAPLVAMRPGLSWGNHLDQAALSR